MRFLALIALCCLLAFAVFANVAAEEEEEPFCPCPRNLDPVCGSDARTYSNPCELACAAKRVARQGRSLSLARAGSC